MTERDRFLRTFAYEDVDRRPLYFVGPWPDTVARWHREGLPADINGSNLHAYFGLEPLKLRYVGADMGPYPRFEEELISEDERFRIFKDAYGRTVRDLKHESTLPEWMDFPVKNAADLERVLEERYSLEHLDARFGEKWEQQVAEAARSDDVLVVDGGCYYWTLRSLAGVEVASYLFYDAPALVEELFERYCVVVLEAMQRAMARVQVDVVGFGEDIGYKTGTLISPPMFRQFILPRYQRAMDTAHDHGVQYTWYDSDGDIRPFIPDYLSVGINGLAPCEVAASMAPWELRATYGRDLRMIGGIDKREIARGPAAIDAEIERNRPVIEEGGYVPSIDHSISADIGYDDYCYFVEKIQEALEV